MDVSMKKPALGAAFARAAIVVAATLLILAAMGTPTGAAPASKQAAAVFDLQAGLAEVDGATASLTRTSNGINFTLRTSGLHGGHAYTVWWIVYNHPEFCEHPMLPGTSCGFLDIDAPDFGLHGDPRVQVTIVRAAGHVVGNNGRAGFGGSLRVGDTSEVVMGPGLVNPAGAEVMIDALDHGAKDPRNVSTQISTFVTEEGSCNPECHDHQLASFPAN